MKKNFNVWFEPWIPVEKTDGSVTHAGIYEALKDSTNIRAIRGTMPPETFGIIRLLITILIDIYRPGRWIDIGIMWNNGKFESKKLDDYYNLCLSEGISFDLFDTDRPFLQYPLKEEKLKSAANLFDHLPTGNNVPHFMHNEEDSYAFTPQRCLQALCSIPFYEKHKRGEKVTAGINGTPPIYFLYNGDTLFETLIFSLFPKSQYPENDYGKPVWRDCDCFKGQINGTPDLLHALFCAPLNIKLLPSDDGLIRQVCFDEGINYKDVIWTDPHVAYITEKDKRRALLPKNGRAVWRDLPVIIDSNAIKILYDVENRLKDKSYSLTAFVRFCLSKSVLTMPLTQFTEELNIPIGLLENKMKRKCYSDAISLSDNIASECGRTLRTAVKINDGGRTINPYAEALQSIFTRAFLTEIKETFDNTLVSLLNDADTDTPDWETKINEYLTEKIKESVFKALNAVFDKISDENVDTLILKTILRNRVNKKLNYILKEVKL